MLARKVITGNLRSKFTDLAALKRGITVNPWAVSLAMLAGVRLWFGGAARAGEGFWYAGGGGSWANAASWDSSGIADGTDNNAYFGFTFEPAIPASTTFTLDGARTIGNLSFIPQNGQSTWVLSTGSGGPLTLDTTFQTPNIDVNANAQVTISAVLAGNKGLNKDGDGMLILAGQNTYSGNTTVSAGTLLVTGTIGSSSILVQGGTLKSAGTIGGPMTVASGSTLSLDNAIGALTIDNTLALQAGSVTLIKVNAATLAHDLVQGLTSVNYGGTLLISNQGGTLAAGQSFQIFSAASATGNFSAITPPPGPGLKWQFDPASGVLSVLATTLAQPRIANVLLSGGNLVMLVTNGVPQATSYVLTATDLSQPLTNWTRMATNVFDANGNLNFTNSPNPGAPARYFLIATPSGL